MTNLTGLHFINMIIDECCAITFIVMHYDNTPIQYTANFNGCKNYNFQLKFLNYFLIFVRNIDSSPPIDPCTFFHGK